MGKPSSKKRKISIESNHGPNPPRNQKLARLERTAFLTHDTREKRDARKLQLHLARTKRNIDALRHRLTSWDPVEEAEKERKEQEEQKKADEPKPKYRRPGPETWKLKGAARPAWQIYDFDTRHVDPHAEAHEKAKDKVQRIQNLLSLYKGKLAELELGRDFLQLLMEYGHLSVSNKQYKSAREAFLECMELEGDDSPVTTARETLMRMYVDLGRWDAAYRLGERLEHDNSVWIRYSMALAAAQLENPNAREIMVRAITSNVFCAYYLCNYETFDSVMEYTDDIDEADEQPQSSLEEAIDYCSSRAKLWTGDAVSTLQQVLRSLPPVDVEWKDRLTQIEVALTKREHDETNPDTTAGVDVAMFAGMFRTAMEMTESAGVV